MNFTNILKLGFILMVSCIISAGSLSYIYVNTQPLIEKSKAEEIKLLLTEVLPETTSFETLEEFEPVVIDKKVKITNIYLGQNSSNQNHGLVVKSEVVGYGGFIVLLIGISKEEKVVGIKIVEHKETPGLGSKIAENGFLSIFRNKPLNSPFQIKSDIVAIAGATKSSAAVALAVQKVSKLVLDNKEDWLK